LSSSAAAGEILVSENAVTEDLNLDRLEARRLELKGKSEPVNVYVLKES
jgi:class 3 adenylate cyclase